jgi:hypothetical protein
MGVRRSSAQSPVLDTQGYSKELCAFDLPTLVHLACTSASLVHVQCCQIRSHPAGLCNSELEDISQASLVPVA